MTLAMHSHASARVVIEVKLMAEKTHEMTDAAIEAIRAKEIAEIEKEKEVQQAEIKVQEANAVAAAKAALVKAKDSTIDFFRRRVDQLTKPSANFPGVPKITSPFRGKKNKN